MSRFALGILMFAGARAITPESFVFEQAIFPHTPFSQIIDNPMVWPQAPKGGQVVVGQLLDLDAHEGPDSFYIPGKTPTHFKLVHATLFHMLRHPTHGPCAYPYVADAMEQDGDHRVFFLNPKAQFHDHTPITADDVVFSFAHVCKTSPDVYKNLYKNIQSIEAKDGLTVHVTFKKDAPRQTAFWLSQMPIFSKSGLTKGKLVESGPYSSQGEKNPEDRFVYTRMKDWWGKDLACAKGLYNVDRVIYRHFLQEKSLLEALYDGKLDVGMASGLIASAFDERLPDERWVKMTVPLEPKITYSFIFNEKSPLLASLPVRKALILLLTSQDSDQRSAYSLLEKDGWRLRQGLWTKGDTVLSLVCPMPHGRWVGKLSATMRHLADHGIDIKTPIMTPKDYVKLQQDVKFDLMVVPLEAHKALTALSLPLPLMDHLPATHPSLISAVHERGQEALSCPIVGGEQESVQIIMRPHIHLPKDVMDLNALWIVEKEAEKEAEKEVKKDAQKDTVSQSNKTSTLD